MKKISFASDNYAGIHPEILQAIVNANHDHVPAYGGDHYTEEAIEKFREHFGLEAEVFFVFNGTAANVTSLMAINKSYQAILCAERAHIQMDECGAPEKFIGSKLILLSTAEGKISVASLKPHLERLHDQHAVQPHVISISQSTEYGTVYKPDEIKALADFAHAHHMFLHMDGARICNAAVSLQLELRQITKEVGVDVLSFGGTKNGMMLGEAVIFFNKTLAQEFQFIRKQSMQLASKMRFIATQFHALLSNDLWKHNALHANKMAHILAKKLMTFSNIKVTHPVDANALFVIMPKALINHLQKKYNFYIWDEALSEVRLMTSFDTTEEEIKTFIADIDSFSA